MMGTAPASSAWLKRHQFPILLILVMFAAYGVGKDRAMKENRKDAALRASQNLEG